jgi:amidase
MDDLAFSGGGDTSAYGPTLCPFDRTRTAGGSSGGSAAALWYEGVDAALGTDQGGSIRVPAAWCGVVGLKPTHGLVPYAGIVGIDQTLDHAGPIARTVEETALLLQAIAGPHEDDPRQRAVPAADYRAAVADAPADLAGIRIGVVGEAFGEEVGAEPAVTEAAHAAAGRFERLGAELRELSVPEHLQVGGVAFATFIEGMTALVAGGGNGFHWPGRYAPDLARALGDGIARRGDELPPQVKVTLVLGAHLQARYRGAVYARGQNLRPRLRAGFDRALGEVDALLLPTTPGLPHLDDPSLSISERVLRGWAVLANTYPTDLTGHPALSLPAAEAEGLPVGVMLIGRRFDDASLLAIARTYERRYGWLPASAPTLSG